MKAIITIPSFVSDLVLSWWTPFFVALFLAIVAYTLWPRNRETFDAASKMPLRED
jgi:cytochrome c oxidase cbb3-type subunit 4